MPVITSNMYVLYEYSSATGASGWYASSTEPPFPYSASQFTPINQWTYPTGASEVFVTLHFAYANPQGDPPQVYFKVGASDGFALRVDANQPMLKLGDIGLDPNTTLVAGKLIGDDPKIQVTKSTGQDTNPNYVYLSYDGASSTWLYATSRSSSQPAAASYVPYDCNSAIALSQSGDLETHISVTNGTTATHWRGIGSRTSTDGIWLGYAGVLLEPGTSRSTAFATRDAYIEYSVNLYDELSSTLFA